MCGLMMVVFSLLLGGSFGKVWSSRVGGELDHLRRPFQLVRGIYFVAYFRLLTSLLF